MFNLFEMFILYYRYYISLYYIHVAVASTSTINYIYCIGNIITGCSITPHLRLLLD
jgi:hypothetical protein